MNMYVSPFIFGVQYLVSPVSSDVTPHPGDFLPYGGDPQNGLNINRNAWNHGIVKNI